MITNRSPEIFSANRFPVWCWRWDFTKCVGGRIGTDQIPQISNLTRLLSISCQICRLSTVTVVGKLLIPLFKTFTKKYGDMYRSFAHQKYWVKKTNPGILLWYLLCVSIFIQSAPQQCGNPPVLVSSVCHQFPLSELFWPWHQNICQHLRYVRILRAILLISFVW